jgi:hypothetical protein
MRQPFLFKIVLDAFVANLDVCLPITGANDPVGVAESVSTPEN